MKWSKRLTIAWRLLLLSVTATALQAKSAETRADQTKATAGTRADIAAVFAANPKLRQKVKIHCEGIAVGELLNALSQKMGVVLTADAFVADQKAIVFSPARPLKDTLNDLAALFNATWQKSGDRSAYRLTRSRAAQEYDNRLVERLPNRIETGLDVYVRALNEPTAQIALRDPNDLIRVYAGNSAGRLAGHIYQWLRPSQRETFLTLRHLTVPFDNLPAEMKQGLRAEYTQHIAENARRRQQEPGGYPYPVGKIEDLDGSVLRFDLSLLHGGYLPHIAFGQGASLYFGRVDARDTYLVPPHGNPYTGNPAAPDTALPAPRFLNESARQATWTDRLKALAESTGVPILADYYRNPPVILEPIQTPSGEREAGITAGSPLDVFCRSAGYLWWTHGPTLLFRKRDWYDQHRYEVPDRWIRETIRLVEAHNDYPTFTDVFRLRELTYPQMMGLCGDSVDVAQYDTSDYSGAPELLAIMQAEIRNPNARLPEAGVVRPDEEMAVAWPITALTSHQKPLLDAFLNALHYELPGPQSKVFRAEIGYGGLPKNHERGGYRYHRLVLDAKYDHDETHYFTRLSLPATLIDDRSDQTRIELVR